MSSNTDLTPSQQQALQQIRDLTNGADDDVSISILQSVDWDVHKAADVIFSGGLAPPRAPSVPTLPSSRAGAGTEEPRFERFELDDSESSYAPPRGRSQPNSWQLIPRPLLSILTFPFHLISNILHFVFSLLRIPVPQFSLLNFYTRRATRRPPPPSSRRGVNPTEAWIRELEEETGAVCIGRSTANSTNTSGTAGPSTSTLTSRTNVGAGVGATEKFLPDFYTGTYEQALRLCQKEFRIACVILVSEEHDDVVEFKRQTLTDSKFVKLLQENDILVWGGDVRDHEAWSASEKLQATTYPFVAFVALQPTRTIASSSSTSSSNSTPSMTVLSRHQGPPSSLTSPSTLTHHLTTLLLPRVTPFLQRQKSLQHQRNTERLLREEQDRAFALSAQRDRERIHARMEAERVAREEQGRREEKEAMEAALKASIAEEKQRAEETRTAWRRWTRRNVVAPFLNTASTGVRLAIRLPDNRRVVQTFPGDTSLTLLYAYIDTQMLSTSVDDPESVPSGNTELRGEAALNATVVSSPSGQTWWGFKLVNAYPRQDIPWSSSGRIADFACLSGGGQVVVEMLESGQVDDDDEEEEEEEE
ncbi:hypothetical protein ONZ45_g10032 [Pleurotus djamor]|nr:hypothetical protein ONZ45_g10032 [Pleurotus djamor]